MTSTAQRILIVEDETQLAEVLADYLKMSGFEVEISNTGAGVVEAVRAAAPALILLDLMLPVMDGISICRELRTFSQVPIIMVTARVEEIDRLLGLELGADDYVCKPYSPREVVARVKAVLRRGAAAAQAAANGAEDPAGDGLHLDEERFLARVNGTALELTPVEFRLLRVLVQRPGRVLSRTQLIDHLYDDHRVVSDRTVDSHVKNLRKKLQMVVPEEEFIHSVYGVGYKLEWG